VAQLHDNGEFTSGVATGEPSSLDLGTDLDGWIASPLEAMDGNDHAVAAEHQTA
jgi:hypothetical protein